MSRSELSSSRRCSSSSSPCGSCAPCLLPGSDGLSAPTREIQIRARKMFGALTWKALQDPIVLAWLTYFLFFLLQGASTLVFVGLLPTLRYLRASGKQEERGGETN